MGVAYSLCYVVQRWCKHCVVCSKLQGYQDVVEYYESCSCSNFIGNVSYLYLLQTASFIIIIILTSNKYYGDGVLLHWTSQKIVSKIKQKMAASVLKRVTHTKMD